MNCSSPWKMKQMIHKIIAALPGNLYGKWIYAHHSRIARPCILLVLTMAVTGCSVLSYLWMGPDVTKDEPYSEYVGRTLTLRRPAFLFRDNLGTELGDPSDRFFMAPSGRKVVHIADLPSGTKLWLRQIIRAPEFEAGYQVTAYGSISTPTSAEPIRFQYNWGIDYLRRAPWEDDTIPEKRLMIYAGKKTEH